MSTNFVSSADSQQNNFQPSWMRSTFNGGVTSPRQFSSQENEEGMLMSAPILVANRYGREDLLALVGTASNPPEGLRKCPLFVDKQIPVVLTNLTEIEERFAQNINSSKAMYKATHMERMNSSGDNPANISSGSPRGAGGWTPVKQTRPERTAAAVNGSGTGASVRGRGFISNRGARMSTETPSEENPPMSMYGQRYVTRGRGAASMARGGSTSAATFNSRAQGLYDPKDPKDRPRNRAPEEPENNGNEWQSTPSKTNAWNRSESNDPSGIVRESSQPSMGGTNSWKQQDDISTSTAPEWAASDEVADELNGPGSFDDKGRFHSLKDAEPSSAVSREPWSSTQQKFLNRMQSEDDSEGNHRVSPDSLAYSHLSEIRPQKAAAAPAVPTKASSPPVIMFTYVDPSNQERGPFPEAQMKGWFQAGYFVDDLKVKRTIDDQYKTLGDLKKQNGSTTPFDFKEQLPPPPPEPLNFFSQPTFPSTIFGGNQSPWSTTPQIYGAQNVMYDPVNAELKRIEEEKLRFQEQMRQKEREMREAIEKQAQEQAKVILEREAALKAKEAEVTRLMEQERMRIEMEQMEIRKRQQKLQEEEALRKAALQKLEDDARREKDTREAELRMKIELEKERRRKIEAEEKRKKDLEEAKKKAEVDKRRAEVAAEEHKRLMEKKAAEDAAKIKAQEKRRQQSVEDEALAAALQQQEQYVEKPEISSEWETVSSHAKKTSAPKVAPWVGSAAAVREKTLKEIQEEEERQLRAEQEELNKLRKQQQKQNSSTNILSGNWNNASQKLSWSQPAKSVAAKSTLPAWGGVGTIDPQPAAPSPFWDGPSLQAANRPAVAPQPKKPVAVAKPSPAATKNTTKNAAKAAAKSPATKKQDDQFEQWVVQKLKQINPAVEAEVLASFLQTVQNPNEVEDYVEGYLGSNKMAKEFVKEFLQKRIDHRRSNKTDKDDLSCASVAPATGTAGGKKKKNKGERVIDTSFLGFSATSDPNRFNQGEIETVALPPGQKR